MFSIYVVTTIKESIARRRMGSHEALYVNSQFAVSTILRISFFALGIPALIIAKVVSIIKSDELYLFLGILETILAVYIILLADDFNENRIAVE